MEFYTRNPMPQEDIISGAKAAQKQNQLILKIFQSDPFAYLTPRAVYRKIIDMGREIELTSVRRGITTLCKQGWLIKRDDRQVIENKGKHNCVWVLNPFKF